MAENFEAMKTSIGEPELEGSVRFVAADRRRRLQIFQHPHPHPTPHSVILLTLSVCLEDIPSFLLSGNLLHVFFLVLVVFQTLPCMSEKSQT